MCGRFALTLPNDALAQLFAASPANTLPLLPNYNICPTNPVACVLAYAGGGALALCFGNLCRIGMRGLTQGRC